MGIAIALTDTLLGRVFLMIYSYAKTITFL